MNGIVKNDALCKRLCDDVRNSTLSHAYIIAGDRGSGKHKIALMLAASISCENRTEKNAVLPCCTCRSCRKILEGKSPDIIYVNKGDKASIGVEAIRFIREDVTIVPNDIESKIYIIEGADLMTAAAQNALLLTLEEPPRYVLFLLLCEKAEALLETVRSRAPILRTERIKPNDIDTYLLSHEPNAKALKSSSPAEYEELLVASDGSIGKAIELLDPKLRAPILQNRRTAQDFIELFRERNRSEKMISLLSAFSQKRDELSEQLLTVGKALRDLILLKKEADAPLCFFYDREAALEFSDSFRIASLLCLYDRVENALDALSRNANVKLTLINLLSASGIS